MKRTESHHYYRSPPSGKTYVNASDSRLSKSFETSKQRLEKNIHHMRTGAFVKKGDKINEQTCKNLMAYKNQPKKTEYSPLTWDTPEFHKHMAEFHLANPPKSPMSIFDGFTQRREESETSNLNLHSKSNGSVTSSFSSLRASVGDSTYLQDISDVSSLSDSGNTCIKCKPDSNEIKTTTEGRMSHSGYSESFKVSSSLTNGSDHTGEEGISAHSFDHPESCKGILSAELTDINLSGGVSGERDTSLVAGIGKMMSDKLTNLNMLSDQSANQSDSKTLYRDREHIPAIMTIASNICNDSDLNRPSEERALNIAHATDGNRRGKHFSDISGLDSSLVFDINTNKQSLRTHESRLVNSIDIRNQPSGKQALNFEENILNKIRMEQSRLGEDNEENEINAMEKRQHSSKRSIKEEFRSLREEANCGVSVEDLEVSSSSPLEKCDSQSGRVPVNSNTQSLLSYPSERELKSDQASPKEKRGVSFAPENKVDRRAKDGHPLIPKEKIPGSSRRDRDHRGHNCLPGEANRNTHPPYYPYYPYPENLYFGSTTTGPSAYAMTKSMALKRQNIPTKAEPITFAPWRPKMATIYFKQRPPLTGSYSFDAKDKVYGKEDYLDKYDDSCFPTNHSLDNSRALNQAMNQVRVRERRGRMRRGPVTTENLQSEGVNTINSFTPTSRYDLQLKYRYILSKIKRKSYLDWKAETTARAALNVIEQNDGFDQDALDTQPAQKPKPVRGRDQLEHNESNVYGSHGTTPVMTQNQVACKTNRIASETPELWSPSDAKGLWIKSTPWPGSTGKFEDIDSGVVFHHRLSTEAFSGMLPSVAVVCDKHKQKCICTACAKSAYWVNTMCHSNLSIDQAQNQPKSQQKDWIKMSSSEENGNLDTDFGPSPKNEKVENETVNRIPKSDQNSIRSPNWKHTPIETENKVSGVGSSVVCKSDSSHTDEKNQKEIIRNWEINKLDNELKHSVSTLNIRVGGAPSIEDRMGRAILENLQPVTGRRKKMFV